MRIVVHLLFLSLSLSGCATTSPVCAIPTATGKDAATIVIYRPSGSYGRYYSTPFSIDNCRIENLDNNSFAVYKLPSGNHRVAAERHALAQGGDGVVSGNFEAGKTYYLHYSMKLESTTIIPTVGAWSTNSTQFYISTKEHAFEVMPQLAGVK